MMKGMKVNKNLIWDYSYTDAETESESFKRWYLARVLMRGGAQDIRDVGVETIRIYLPRLTLPKRIRVFWDWYFNG